MLEPAPVSFHLDLYRYWLSKRGSRAMPARGDIDPTEIPQMHPYILIVGRDSDQFCYRLIGSAIVQTVGYDATGTTVGSYVSVPGVAEEARAIFERVFTSLRPVFVTGEYFPRSGACLCLSLLTLPLSADDRTAVSKTISTLAACFSPELKPDRGWLARVPVRVSNVCDVRDTAELETLCREWEQSCKACN
jgi:hypothetical protein